MTTVEQLPQSESEKPINYGEHPVAYTEEYSPTTGQSSMKNVLDSARFGLMENPRLEQIEWNEIVDLYWSTKPQIDGDPTGPLALADALSTIVQPESIQEKNSLDEMFLDAFHEIAEHPDLITFKSFLTGIHAIDKMQSKEHKEEGLEIIEGILGTLEEINLAGGETELKTDPKLLSVASAGLREYRALLKHDRPASLEKTVTKPAQHQIEMAIAHGAEEYMEIMRTRSEASPLGESQGLSPQRADVPELTKEEYEQLLEDHMYAKMRDKRRRAEWDAYYENGGNPVEDIEGVMDPTYQTEVKDNVDPESTGALMVRELEKIDAIDEHEIVSQKLLMHQLGNRAAARAVADAEKLKQAS
jgi:hypothetical protein